MIRRLKTGEFRIVSRSKDASTGRRRNLGTYRTREEALRRERQVRFFKEQR